MKTKIQKFRYWLLHNAEHLQFIKMIFEVIAVHGAEKLNIVMLFNELFKLITEEEIAISVERGSVYTVRRDAADHRRNRKYSSLYHHVMSYIYDEDNVKICEAAQRVMRIFRQVGNPSKVADFAQSTIIMQLYNELQNYATDIELIGATQRLESLKDANKEFEEMDELCRNDKKGRPSGNVKAVRAKINPVYISIVNAINADIDRFGDNRLGEVVTDMNAVIKNFDTLLAQRKARNSNNDVPKEENSETGGKENSVE